MYTERQEFHSKGPTTILPPPHLQTLRLDQLSNAGLPFTGTEIAVPRVALRNPAASWSSIWI